MSNDLGSLGLIAAAAAFAVAAGSQPLSHEAALGISAAMGVVGGTVSALAMAGDASLSARRVAVCVLTTAMVAPMIVFTTLDTLHDGSRHLIPVVTTSGVAGLIAWPVTDKTMRAFSTVSPQKFGRWLVDTLRKVIGGS